MITNNNESTHMRTVFYVYSCFLWSSDDFILILFFIGHCLSNTFYFQLAKL